MSLPGGWEIIIIIAVIFILFKGGNAVDSLKNAGKNLYKVKKEIDDIKNINDKI